MGYVGHVSLITCLDKYNHGCMAFTLSKYLGKAYSIHLYKPQAMAHVTLTTLIKRWLMEIRDGWEGKVRLPNSSPDACLGNCVKVQTMATLVCVYCIIYQQAWDPLLLIPDIWSCDIAQSKLYSNRAVKHAIKLCRLL